MKTVLDAPVPALEIEKIAGISSLATEARNEVAGLFTAFAMDHASPFDPNCLLEMRPVEVAI